MSHRVIISNAIREALADQAVQAEMSQTTTNRMSQIVPAEGEIDPENFPRVAHCLTRLYCQED